MLVLAAQGGGVLSTGVRAATHHLEHRQAAGAREPDDKQDRQHKENDLRVVL